jgi:hypothetical protein
MSFHQSPSALTSHQAAIEQMPSDPAQVGGFFDKLFAAKDKEAEERARIKQEYKAREYEDAIQERLGVRRNCLKSTKFWRQEFLRNRYEASVGFTQLLYIARTQGWMDPVEAPEDETPVMDRTKTARRMSSFNPSRGGARGSYGMTIQTVYQREVAETAERLYQKLVDGVPLNRLREGEGAGRPSKAWQEAYQLAYDRFERETDPNLQSESEEQAH